MELLPGTVTRLLPEPLAYGYASLNPLRREDMVQITFDAMRRGRSPEEATHALRDAGIEEGLAGWYVAQVWEARAPVAPHSDYVEAGAEPPVTSPSARGYGVPILLSAVGCVGLLAGIIALFFNPTVFGPHGLEPIATLLIVAFKASQVTLAYYLAVAQGKRGSYFAALTVLLGWFSILYLIVTGIIARFR